MLTNNSKITGIIGKQDRDQFASKVRYTMANALVDAWRAGECKLVKQTIDSAGSALMRTQWKQDTALLLLPTEIPYFNQYIG